MILSLICILLSLLMSALFSGAETAFLSTNVLLFELEKKKSKLKNRIFSLYFKYPNLFVTSMQIGKIFALIVFCLQIVYLTSGWFPEQLSKPLLFLFQTLIAAVLLLLGGEFLPKMLSKISPEILLPPLAIPLFPFFVLFFPFAFILYSIAALFLKMLGLKISLKHPLKKFEKEDLNLFFQPQHTERGFYEEEVEPEAEVKYLQNALEFKNVKLRNCIVPRTEIVAFDIQTTIEELLSAFIETGLSKILIFKDDIDNIIGYIHSSEMFAKPQDWTKHINPISVVPENMAAKKLMKVMLQEKKNIAVVVDEFGGTSGVVTLEDFVEEIFGEIEDEHDTKSQVIRKISDSVYVFSGRIELDRINEEFGLEIPESEDYVTIAGYILNHIKKFPQRHESIVIGKYTFKILKVTNTKIELVRLIVAE